MKDWHQKLADARRPEGWLLCLRAMHIGVASCPWPRPEDIRPGIDWDFDDLVISLHIGIMFGSLLGGIF